MSDERIPTSELVDFLAAKSHYHVEEDGWFCCPACPDYIQGDRRDDVCRCGVEKFHEAAQRLRELEAEVKGMRPVFDRARDDTILRELLETTDGEEWKR